MALADIPFYGAYKQAQAANQESDLNTMKTAMTLSQLQQSMQDRNRKEALRVAMQQSGGDPSKAMQIALQNGDFAGAASLAPLIASMEKAAQTKTLASLDMNDPDAISRAAIATKNAPLMAEAERIRKRRSDAAELESLRGTPQGIPAGMPIPNSGGMQTMTEISPEDRGAFEQVASAAGRGQPARALGGETPQRMNPELSRMMMSELPWVSNLARSLNTQLQNSGAASTSESWLRRIQNLGEMEGKALEGRNTREQSAADRKALLNNRQPTTPSGYRVSADGNLEAIPGGPGDKNSFNFAGGRESTQINRIVMASNQAAQDLKNVAQLPITATRGLFGGRTQGPGLFDAGMETLTNSMTTQEVQSYNVLATGFQRNLAAIEAAGLAPTNALMHQMDAVMLKEGDTNFTKLQKLAQIRQIVEAGMETITSNPRVPPETKKHLESIVTSVKSSVPFTQEDLIELQKQGAVNKNITLSDVVPALKAAQTTTTEPTIINRSTGERLYFRDGKWQLLQK